MIVLVDSAQIIDAILAQESEKFVIYACLPCNDDNCLGYTMAS